MTLTADKLVNKVCRRCFWPVDSGTGLASNAPLTTAEILELADEEIAGQLKPQQLTVGGGYDLVTLDYAITAGQSLYRMPGRAFGPIQDLIEVQTDLSASELSMPMASLEDIARPERLRLRSRTQYLATVDGEFLRLYPAPVTTDGKKLRIRYFRARNLLTLVANSTTLTGRTQAGGFDIIATTATMAPFLGDGSAGADVIAGGGAHGAMAFEQVSTVVTTHASVDLSQFPNGWVNAAAGDYVCAVGYTPVAQVPEMMEPLLILRVAAAALHANGERDAAAELEGMAQQRENQVQELLKPRVAAEPDYIVTRNSVLRSGSIRGRMW